MRWASGLLASAAVSHAPAAALMLTAAGSALVFVETPGRSRWLGTAPDTGLFLTVLSFAVAGCLFAVIGYLAGARWSSDRGYRLRRSVPPVPRVVLVAVGGDLVWLVGALVLVHAVAYGRSAAEGAVGLASAWPLSLLGLAAAVSCYAVAAMVGAVLRTPFGVVLVTPAPYAATLLAGEAALSPRPELQQLVAPFVDQAWYPNLVPNPGPLLVLATYCLAVAATAAVVLMVVLGMRLRVAAPRPAAVLVPAAATAVTALLVAAGWSPNGFARPNPAGALCAGDDRVCVWASSPDALPVLVSAEQRVREAVVGLGAPADLRFSQNGLERGEEVVAVQTSPTGLDEGAVVVEMVSAYVEALMAECGTDIDALTAKADLHDALLRASSGEPVGGRDTYERGLSAC